MGRDSNIQWTDSTVNGSTGCPGCELWPGPCYAGPLHENRLAKSLPHLYAPSFTEVRLAPGRMVKAAGWSDLTGTARTGKPWLDGMPRLIFVGDMGDFFAKDIPFEYLKSELIDVAASKRGSRHIWQVLTKQPALLAAFDRWLESQGIDWPENIWAGTSVTSPKTVGRIGHLARVRAKVKFVSLEPLWAPVDLTPYLDWLGWVVVGGQSDQGAYKAPMFDLGWVRKLIDVCAVGVPLFLKQVGSWAVAGGIIQPLSDHHGGDWSEWPEDLRVREMPRVASMAEAS